jgi:hypothetical protein
MRFVKADLIKVFFLIIVGLAGGCENVVRTYSGIPLTRDQVAVINMDPVLFTSEYRGGWSSIAEIDGKPVNKTGGWAANKTELLPGAHIIKGCYTSSSRGYGYITYYHYSYTTITVELEAGKVYELFDMWLRETKSKKNIGCFF